MQLSEKFYGSPRLTGEILDCSMPFTFDQYSNCGHFCLYCFSTFQRSITSASTEYFKRDVVKAVNVDAFKRLFQPDYKGVFAYIIKQRKPIQWGGLSDPFCPIEKEFGVGLEILRFLSEIKYPVSFSSKGDLLLTDKRYWNAFMANKENYHYKASIITLNERAWKTVEPGTPSPHRRFEVLKALSDAGVNTTLRMRPYIIGITDKDALEMVRMAAEAGCKSVSTEFLCLEQRAKPQVKKKLELIGKVCGFDIFEYYKKLSPGQSGYLRLNPKTKEKYLKPLKEECEKYGLRLHVSDAHHKEVSCTGSCCGLPDDHPTLSNYQKSQFTNAILIAKKNGKVKFSDIKEDFEWLKSFDYTTAIHESGTDERNKKGKMSMYDYMRNVWNNPKSGKSPYKYFGGALYPVEKDENGDLIYEYRGIWKL